mmetsp:Transcript_143396/g.458652  ORF Transcript_143396/g.458652 Transcript_143396/m.458652 type:complete len:218 (+) Transcript_143396:591-1244(+)
MSTGSLASTSSKFKLDCGSSSSTSGQTSWATGGASGSSAVGSTKGSGSNFRRCLVLTASSRTASRVIAVLLSGWPAAVEPAVCASNRSRNSWPFPPFPPRSTASAQHSPSWSSAVPSSSAQRLQKCAILQEGQMVASSGSASTPVQRLQRLDSSLSSSATAMGAHRNTTSPALKSRVEAQPRPFPACSKTVNGKAMAPPQPPFGGGRAALEATSTTP